MGEVIDRSKREVQKLEKFLIGDLAGFLSAQLKTKVLKRDIDYGEGISYIIERPKETGTSYTDNRYITNVIFEHIKTFYDLKGYTVKKNSDQKRFEIYKDDELLSYIGMSFELLVEKEVKTEIDSIKIWSYID